METSGSWEKELTIPDSMGYDGGVSVKGAAVEERASREEHRTVLQGLGRVPEGAPPQKEEDAERGQ